MRPSAFAVASAARATASASATSSACVSAPPPSARLRRRERRRVAVPERDRGAARRETPRDREADAGGAAGDHGRPVAEIELVHRALRGMRRYFMISTRLMKSSSTPITATTDTTAVSAFFVSPWNTANSSASSAT